jgi:uncharacterized protein (DUF1800 family)
MRQHIFGAPQRVASPLFIRAAGLLVLAAGFLTAVPSAFGQSMAAAIGVYRPSVSKFFLDGNFDKVSDYKQVFGAVSDVGLLGDLAGSGTRYPVLYRNGLWYVDSNKDATVDQTIYFGGAANDKPLIADMNGDGKEDPVLFRDGIWYVSDTHNGAVTATYYLGAPGDVPLIGDVNGSGTSALFVYRNGVWYGSTARNGVVDKTYYFGGVAGDIPMLFDYDGDGRADLGIFRNGTWYVSTNRDGNANVAFGYGTTGDRPLYAGTGAVTNTFLDAARFLTQASFGPVSAEMSSVATMGISAYIDNQLNMPATNFPVFAWQPQNDPANCTSPLTVGGPADPFGTNCPRDLYTQFQVQRFFFERALTAPDQLRQRVAWALSQIWVTSAALDPIAYANRNYQQLLMDHAFGNFEDLMFRVSVDPFMGNYLDMVNNNKGNPVTGTSANENYAREIMQLFSLGVFELNLDGSLLRDAFGNPIETYDQLDVSEISKVFTGWTYWPLTGPVKWNSPINYLYNMTPCEGQPACFNTTNYHDATAKTSLGYNFPAGLSADIDLRTAIRVMFLHPNVGPFISKQLIHHLVTSNPSPAYVNRVANVFNNDSSGAPFPLYRGNMKAVVKAVLMDPEARAARNPVVSTFGKLKEPVLFVTSFLRAMNVASDGVYPLLQTPNMGQNVYTPETVFNYYPADFMIAGTSLAGPQFGILDATTYFRRANFMWNLTLGAACPALTPNLCGQNPDVSVYVNGLPSTLGTRVDYAALVAIANDPVALTQQVNNMLLFGTMSPTMKQQIINAVNAVPVSVPITNAQLRDRARTAVYLTAVSPKYQMEF